MVDKNIQDNLTRGELAKVFTKKYLRTRYIDVLRKSLLLGAGMLVFSVTSLFAADIEVTSGTTTKTADITDANAVTISGTGVLEVTGTTATPVTVTADGVLAVSGTGGINLTEGNVNTSAVGTVAADSTINVDRGRVSSDTMTTLGTWNLKNTVGDLSKSYLQGLTELTIAGGVINVDTDAYAIIGAWGELTGTTLTGAAVAMTGGIINVDSVDATLIGSTIALSGGEVNIKTGATLNVVEKMVGTTPTKGAITLSDTGVLNVSGTLKGDVDGAGKLNVVDSSVIIGDVNGTDADNLIDLTVNNGDTLSSSFEGALTNFNLTTIGTVNVDKDSLEANKLTVTSGKTTLMEDFKVTKDTLVVAGTLDLAAGKKLTTGTFTVDSGATVTGAAGAGVIATSLLDFKAGSTVTLVDPIALTTGLLLNASGTLNGGIAGVGKLSVESSSIITGAVAGTSATALIDLTVNGGSLNTIFKGDLTNFDLTTNGAVMLDKASLTANKLSVAGGTTTLGEDLTVTTVTDVAASGTLALGSKKLTTDTFTVNDGATVTGQAGASVDATKALAFTAGTVNLTGANINTAAAGTAEATSIINVNQGGGVSSDTMTTSGTWNLGENSNLRGVSKLTIAAGAINTNAAGSMIGAWAKAGDALTGADVEMTGGEINFKSANATLIGDTITISGDSMVNVDAGVTLNVIKSTDGTTPVANNITLSDAGSPMLVVRGTLNGGVVGTGGGLGVVSGSVIKGDVKGTGVDKFIDVRAVEGSLNSIFKGELTNFDLNTGGTAASVVTLDKDVTPNNLIVDTGKATLGRDITVTVDTKVGEVVQPGQPGQSDGIGTLDLGTHKLTTTKFTVIDKGTVAFRISAKDKFGSVEASGDITIGADTNLNLTLDNGVLAKGVTEKFEVFNKKATFTNLSKNLRYLFVDNGDGSFDVTGNATAGDIVSEAGGSSNTVAAATAWSSTGSFPAGSTAATVADLLNGLSQNDASAYVKALDALAPDAAPVVSAQAQAQNQQLFNVADSRMDNTSKGRSGGDVFQKAGLWVQGLYGKTKLDKSTGFDSKNTGIALGGDAYLMDDLKAGLGFAYTRSDINSTGRSTDVNTYSLFAYGQHNFDDLFINGALTYGRSSYDETKDVAGLKIGAKYNVNSFGIQAMAGYHFDVHQNGVLTPEGGLRYMYAGQDSYTDGAGQHIKADSTNTLTGVLGVGYAYTHKEDGFNLVPEVRAAVAYDLVDAKNKVVVGLANGSTYQVKGEGLNRFGMEAGAKLGVEFGNVELSLAYKGQFRSKYSDHTGLVNFRYNF